MWGNDTSGSFKVMAFLRKSGSLVAVWIKSFATAARCSFWSSNRSCGTNFATTNFMPRSCVKISDTVVLGIPRSTSSSHCQLLTFVDCSRYLFNILRCSACCRPSRMWITFKTFSATFEASVPHFYLCCTHCIIPESFLNHPNRFCGGMFKLNEKSDADSLLYLLSHFECNGHTVHTLTQQCLPPPLTSTVKSSLFTHAHSSPLSLAAKWHPCCAKCSCYINDGSIFSGQTLHIYLMFNTYTF